MENKKENKLIPNSTQIPNVILDLIIPKISEAEAKCLLYVCRRTYGFHKERDRISLSQFVDGLKDRNGNKLDYGAGLSRPAVVEALRNLIGAGIVNVIKTNSGNYYEINLNLLVENSIEEVVKKVNQLRKLTKIGKESKPKQVKLLNLQNKGNKGNKDNMSQSDTPFNLKEYLEKMKKDKRRAIQIIAIWIEQKGLKPETHKQMESIIKRNLRPAQLLVGYKDEDIIETIKVIKNTDWIKKFTLETVSKFIDETISAKKDKEKIVRFERIEENGRPVVKVIYSKT